MYRHGPVEVLTRAETLRENVREEWANGCRWDGIDTETDFATFTDGNPYAVAYSVAMTEYLDYLREHNV